MAYLHEDKWERPVTTRRYLHPPFAEELATMWSQMALFIGDIYEKDEKKPYSAACQFLVGKDFQIPDFKTVKLITSEDGSPVHGLIYDFGDYTVEAESFCNIKTSPTVYTKFTFTNKVLWPVTDSFGFLLRTYNEQTLNGIFDLDGYCTHNPNIRAWGDAPRHWRAEKENFLTDDTYKIYFNDIEDLRPAWVGEEAGLCWHERGKHTFAFTLDAGESKTFYMAFGKGATETFDYEAEKEKAVVFWNQELERIKVYPKKENPILRKMYRHLVSQLLQMFSHHVGKYDYVLIRQGSLQRRMWPGEVYEFLMALDRIGDFDDYTEKAYEMFFKRLQFTEGENKGQVGNLDGTLPWGSNTSAVVEGLAYKLLVKDDDRYYKKYRDNLYAAFRWMEKTRRSTIHSDLPGKGLFPPMRSSDWEAVCQDWSFTDVHNLLAYQRVLEAFSKYQDIAVPEIKDAMEDYQACIKSCWEKELEEQAGSDELIHYGVLGAEKEDPMISVPNVARIGNMIITGIIPYEGGYIEKYLKYYANRNVFRNGLHEILTANLQYYNMNWIGYTHYTSTGDHVWFKYYMKSGQKSLAEETLKAQLKYSMTDEYYMIERFASNDPYYVPWSPNASANGRTIMMLCDFYNTY